MKEMETRILLNHIDDPAIKTLEGYEKQGGYTTLHKIIGKETPESLVEKVQKAGLRGRGGAGFETGKKWSFLPKDSKERYLVCNCDESEPGTFKDRYVIERNPHQLIEGVILSSYAIRAHIAFIYCRGEFYKGIKTLQNAVKEAIHKQYIGNNILGSNYSLDVIVHPGAGAYIAGEETAQLNSLEGYRATPRLKPPFPAVAGLYGKPTIINNVETLCNVVHILANGPEGYMKNGKPRNYGTKIFQLSGHIRNPGCYEFPIGITLRSLLDAAGGMLPGRTFKACFPGGSSCALLTHEDLNITLDFETLAARGTAFGTASLIIMDDTADMVKVAHRLMQFYQNESCGKCTPCREGTRWVVQILERIERGMGTYQDLDVITDVAHYMEHFSFCPLAVGAAPPVVSTIKHFRQEFERYIAKNPKADENAPMPVAYPYI